ncbi:MAG TPA: exonuclease domain-containing protein [Ktedonobacterales bacterium]
MRSQPVRVAIDLETTGLHPEHDAIIEIGAVKFAGDQLVETFESFVACGSPIPYRVRRLTGISAAQLRGAPALAEILPRLREFLGDYPLVGHSVPFDAAFLRRVGLARRNPLVDTYELASALLPGLPSYALASVGQALGVSSPTYHRALADAQLARDVLLALLTRLDALDAGTLAALGRLTTAADWTPGYFVRQAARAQGISLAPAAAAGGSLGALLSAQLGMDPAVLALAVAREPVETEAETASAQATLAVSAPEPAPEGALGERVARGVGEALETGVPLLVELHNDGEGTQACLTAALRWARTSGERVIVSAASADVAQRLFARELPAAYTAAGVSRTGVPAALANEQESYLCLHRWFGAARTARDGTLAREVARGLAKLIVWLGETRSGALAEVGLSGPELAAWELTRSGPEFTDSDATCTYRREGYCFMERARKAAEQARVVITTHRALAAQLGGLATMLPAAVRVVVLDAHLLEPELRAVRTAVLERHGLLALLDSLGTVGASGRRAGLLHLAAQRASGAQTEAREAQWFAQVKRARQAAEQVFTAASALLAEAQSETIPAPASGGQDARTLRLDAGVWELSAWRTLGARWKLLADRLTAAARTARDAAHLVLTAQSPAATPAADGVATDLLAAARLLERTCAHGERIISADAGGEPLLRWLRVPYPQENGANGPGGAGRRGRQPTYPPAPVRSATRLTAPPAPSDAPDDADNGEGASDEAPMLHAAPVRIGSLLEPLRVAGKGIVLAAPALAAAGDFGYALGNLGAPLEGTRTLAPDLVREEQTLLCLPTDVPEPNAPQFQRRLDDTLIALATALGGRLVALFPSHAALRTAAQGLRRTLEERDILVLAQGQDGSARQLWQTFRTEPRVVLLGAGTFWETADFGDTPPACVVVTRLPFPALGDPLQAARAELWPDAQNQFIVPHAALRVRYALGALAWSHRQRNAVVLFDRRAQTRDYGPVILGTLARCTQYQESVAQIAERVVEWVG